MGNHCIRVNFNTGHKIGKLLTTQKKIEKQNSKRIIFNFKWEDQKKVFSSAQQNIPSQFKYLDSPLFYCLLQHHVNSKRYIRQRLNLWIYFIEFYFYNWLGYLAPILVRKYFGVKWLYRPQNCRFLNLSFSNWIKLTAINWTVFEWNRRYTPFLCRSFYF